MTRLITIFKYKCVNNLTVNLQQLLVKRPGHQSLSLKISDCNTEFHWLKCLHMIKIRVIFSQNLEVRVLAKTTWDVKGSYMFAHCYCFTTPLKLFYGAHSSILIDQIP